MKFRAGWAVGERSAAGGRLSVPCSDDVPRASLRPRIRLSTVQLGWRRAFPLARHLYAIGAVVVVIIVVVSVSFAIGSVATATMQIRVPWGSEQRPQMPEFPTHKDEAASPPTMGAIMGSCEGVVKNKHMLTVRERC
ncbi:hypothetical protein EJ02DRAFT_164327 [Clathrospora elynae]|uniref:Uncharacterized protein n=1 Tax=Clathrospora elynae TaxID=706981 RepID=A0A6A5S4F1_9PLEO|nr:hypothetical protein EJ02DRAFT_164327 [Clathrospora elynae]